MAKKKRFALPTYEIKSLAEGHGGCIATDMITVDGRKVGYMYREEPDNEIDSGWRFLSGRESDEYMDDPDNHGAHDVNTIANCDRDIIPFLNFPIGSAFARNRHSGKFEKVEAEPDEL